MKRAPITARKLHNQLLLFENPVDGQDKASSAEHVARAARELLESEWGLQGRQKRTVGAFVAIGDCKEGKR